ncbi:ThiF family adenylyltransferase [Thermodesulfomicrobium sp. WS]|uniref:HesA/MoeB/ThiF family protein n=1 Tax=Thermodesulfomicrobium sp. WS TaxID=3004129 RepID=UPI002492AE8F|nr:ThiF family adenylyltransferase [Thermodesulfomicrobium sp. WS]
MADLAAVGAGPLDALACGVTPAPWVRSAHSIDGAAQTRLARARVAVVGAGGLGGYAIELLARIGVGFLRIIDGDTFEETNMNRQLLAEPATLGRPKAQVAQERLARIAPWCVVDARAVFVDVGNAAELLGGVDVVLDCLGGVDPRPVVHAACAAASVPVVAAAVAGWTVLVGSELPGKPGISLVWGDASAVDAEGQLGSLAPAVAMAASLQAAEVVQYLTTSRLELAGKVLHADLGTWAFSLYHMSEDE